jgi:hypothetical protein
MACPILGPDTAYIYRNSDKSWLIEVFDKNRAPVDLTGARLTFTVRKKISSTSTLIVKTSDTPGEIDIDPDQTETGNRGQATLFLVPADTVNLVASGEIYDVWVKLQTGEQEPVIEPSRFDIRDPVTLSP